MRTYARRKRRRNATWSAQADARMRRSPRVAIRVCALEGDADAPPLIFGHDCGFAAGSYLPLLLALDGFRVFAFDARGHGGSTRPDPASPQDFGIASVAADLALVGKFVAAKTGRSAHYVGHSMSGTLALWLLASGETSLFSGISLFDPAVFPDRGDASYAEALTQHRRLMTVCGGRRRHWKSCDAYAAALSARGPFALWSPEMIRAHVRATTQATSEGTLESAALPRWKWRSCKV
jgi:pimeloyl-ACP methyl ester carboxylesterase